MAYTPSGYAKKLRKAAQDASPKTVLVLKKGSLNIKKAARDTVASSHSNPGKAAAGYHINFEQIAKLAFEIGYDKPAGGLGTMNEYGSASNSPDNALGMALEEEGPAVEKFLFKEIEKLI